MTVDQLLDLVAAYRTAPDPDAPELLAQIDTAATRLAGNGDQPTDEQERTFDELVALGQELNPNRKEQR